MKTLLFTISAILIASATFGQDQNGSLNDQSFVPVHSRGDFSIALAPNILINTPNGVQFAGGIKCRLFAGKRISFDTDLVFSRDYVQAGPGLIGFPFLLLYSLINPDEEFELGNLEISGNDYSFPIYFLGALFVIMSAEHLSYHIPLSKSIEFSPYASLLRYRWAYEHEYHPDKNRVNEQPCYAIGFEFNRYSDKFLISPYFEYNAGYKDHIPGFNIGIYIGLYFEY